MTAPCADACSPRRFRTSGPTCSWRNGSAARLMSALQRWRCWLPNERTTQGCICRQPFRRRRPHRRRRNLRYRQNSLCGRTFSSSTSPLASVSNGDLELGGSNGQMRRCQTARFAAQEVKSPYSGVNPAESPLCTSSPLQPLRQWRGKWGFEGVCSPVQRQAHRRGWRTAMGALVKDRFPTRVG